MRKFLVAVLILLSLSGTSWALNCSTAVNGTPKTAAQLLANMQDNGQPGNITPGCFRDMVASGDGNATNVINLKNLGLPTGGDDTTAINNALASALPATFTATATIAPTVVTGAASAVTGTLTVTGTPGGTLAVGDIIAGSGFNGQSIIVDYISGTGGAGTYLVMPTQTQASSTTITVQPPATLSVYAPAGTYNHAANIVVKSVCLFGDGDGTNFHATSASASNATVAMWVQGGQPCLKNMMLTNAYGLQGRQTAGSNMAIWMDYAVNYTISGVHIVGTSANKWPAGCLLQDFTVNGQVTQNTCYYSYADAFHVCCTSFGDTESFNYANHPGDDCYPVVSYSSDAGNARKVSIVGNRCDNGSARGLVVEGGSDVTFVGNVVDGAVFCMLAASDSGQLGTDHVVYGDNIILNCGVGGGNAATAIYGTGGSNIVSDIDMHDNHIVASKSLCIAIGEANAAADTLRVSFHHNECDGTVSQAGSNAVDIGGTTDLDVSNNVISTWDANSGIIETNGVANAGVLSITDNKFFNNAGGYNIDLTSTPGFTNVNVIGNHCKTGTGTGMINTTAAFTVLVVEGNVGCGTQTVTGPTDGYWDNPGAGFTHR